MMQTMSLSDLKILFAIATPIVVWFFTKRHFQSRELKLKDKMILSKDVENESASLDVIEKKLSFYEKMLDDLDFRYLKQIEALNNEIVKLEEEGKIKDDIILSLKNRIKKLTGNV